MSKFKCVAATVILALCSGIAAADDWKDESGKGERKHEKHGEYKEEYWDGNCKVERKVEKDGEYKEERKCKAPRRAAPRYVERERVYYEDRVVPVRQPGVRVDVHIDR